MRANGRFSVQIEGLPPELQEAAETALAAETLAISDKYFAGEDNHEQVERLKHSIRLLAELINKGAEKHPALMAPETTANVFPKFEALNSIESQMPRLKDKTEKARES